MEVLDRQEFGAAVVDPALARSALALGAVTVTAGAVTDMREMAMAAGFDGCPQSRRTADFNGAHQTVLIERQRVSLPVRRTVLSKDVGQLQGWLGHGIKTAVCF